MTADTRIGTELAGYRIEESIGRGGMGVVYRAEQLRLGRKVALKLLAPELAENEGFRTRFEHESRLAAAIDHPNIIPLYEAGEADGLLFITMRYVDGTDLKALLERGGPLDPERALAIVGQVAAALDIAHLRGLVHRDVKPGNILVASGAGAETSEHCYLTDFGLTKDTSSPVELTATGTFVGTLDYIAPEQIEGAKPDGRSDLYSLGCVLYECLAAHPPFVRDAEIAVMWAHLKDPPPSLTAERPDLPAGIDRVIAKAMAKAPADRFESCKAMVAAAKVALAPEPATPPAGATRAAATRPAEHPAIAPAGATRVAGTAPAPPLTPAAETAPRAVPPAETAAPPLAAAATVPPVPVPAAGRRRTPAIALGAVLVAAAAIGGAIAGAGGDGGSGESGTSAAAAALNLRFGAPWARGGDAHIVPGLTLTDPIALRAGSARLGAGKVAQPGPGLLPAGIAVGATDLVMLDTTPALRHTGVRSGAGSVTVYAIPTTNGPQALVCAGARAADCEAVAATVRVRGVGLLDVRPSASYANELSRLLSAYSSRVTADRRALAAARTSTAQAAAARAASREQAALARRARQLESPAVAHDAQTAVATAIAGAASGYQHLAAAATAHDAGRYAAARADVSRAAERLRSAVTALGLLGYGVQRHGGG